MAGPPVEDSASEKGGEKGRKRKGRVDRDPSDSGIFLQCDHHVYSQTIFHDIMKS